MLRTASTSGERGSALVAAIALMVIAGFIIVAVMVNGFSSRDSSRATLDRASTEQLAREAGTALSTMYSASESGEFDNFVPSAAVLARYATRGTLEANPAAIGAVDASIPAASRRSLCRSLEDGRIGCWQLFAVRRPDWGQTPAGAVTVYVRAWTRPTNEARLSEPMMYRLDVRPTWLSDYQAVADGKMYFAENATVDGRVHSNGRDVSIFNQDRDYPDQIELHSTVTCGSFARITTTSGTIRAPHASCQADGRRYPNTGRDINLLRATALAARLREIHQTIPAAQRPNVQMTSRRNATAPLTVQLNGDRVATSAGDNLLARVTAANNGAVVITTGDVNISGRLNPGARALIVATREPGQQSFTAGSAPSVTIRQTGDFGAANALTSSLGIVAEGDIIVDTLDGRSCPFTARGAFTAVSGMMSINRHVRVPLYTDDSGRYLCNGRATVRGSIAEHASGVWFQELNRAGYQQRTYTYLPSLFDNPPPMYPTAFDWQVLTFAPADLDCFQRGGGGYVLRTDRGSGCVA
jgi:hypothetical protein